MHDLRARHDGVRRIITGVEILNDALGHARGRAVRRRQVVQRAVRVPVRDIKRRDEHALDLRRRFEKLRLAPAGLARLPEQLEHLIIDLLALADDHEVEKRGHRLRIAAGRAARDHKRRQLRPVGAAQRDAGQIKHIEHGGIRHLIAKRERHDVERADGVAALERVERDARAAHFGFHVAPGGEHALTPDAWHLIHGCIEDAHADV